MALFIGALTRHTIERAARIGDGFITVALDWDETLTKIWWYQDAGGTGTVVVNTIPAYPGTPITPATFTDAMLTDLDLDRAAKADADEMHLTLNLKPVDPDSQVELLEALAAKLGLPS
ncbi:hypothetical protein OG339_45845 [Streptosporangium sp. NBC_01495]|uniref:hypothetical protein n=1 Tax=Streptosporangium sp. NBC_01495 TaxID=2903899 RepID=UPI002E323D9C|nr:hypothetical protein [Streptosporangium sp. NBC_01495]